jgi:type IV pilus assembly protein PilM
MFKTRKVLCLDWDKRSFRAVVARLGSGVMLEDAHSHRLPPALDTEDPAAMGDYIAQTLRRHHWSFKRVVVDVPRDKAVINRLTLPPTPTADVAAAVRFQALKELPFSLDEAVIDFVVTERDANKLVTGVLLAAVRIEVLNRLRDTCAAAGLTPLRIGLRPYANLVSVTNLAGMGEKRVLFVDVGPAMTEIDVFLGGKLAFSRSANVTMPIRLANLVFSEDSRVSSKADLLEVDRSDAEADAAVKDLVLEIVRTLQAFRATEPHAVIDHILIAGDTGLEPLLLEGVEKRLGMPNSLFDPTAALKVGAGEAVKLRSFSAALGLAWGVSREGVLELDFLNPKRPVARSETLKRRLRLGGLAAAGVVLVAGTAYGSVYWRKTRELATIRGQVEVLTKQVRAVRELEARNEEVAEWSREAIWIEHLVNVADTLLEPGKTMLARQIKFDELGPTITLELYYNHWQNATEFVKRLNDLSIDGKPLYRAELQKERESASGDPTFGKMVNVIVRLLDLDAFRHGAKAREQERKRRLTNF